MRAQPLLLLLFLAGPAAAQDDSGPPAGCKEDRITCREDCSVEYGSSTRNYKKLGSCLGTCNYRYDKCRELHRALQKQKELEIEPPLASPTPVPPEEPGQSASAAEGSPEDNAAPSDSSEPDEPGVRRGVYRASEVAEPEPVKGSEPETPAPTEPEPKPAEATAPAEEEPLVDEAPPPPPPPPKPKPKPAPKRTQPPTEPKKKDISDWDPDGK
ncbi:MAG: hypothetical protein JXB05_12600 [Myxococcaceae bacterium]|nr:hypothetical protein [Myxococcaceae bacterium]